MKNLLDFLRSFFRKDDGNPWIGFWVIFVIPIGSWALNGMDKTKFMRTLIFAIFFGSMSFLARKLKRERP